jgi:hypothetical protein
MTNCTHERCIRDNCLTCCFCGTELHKASVTAEIGSATSGSWSMSPNFLPYESAARTPVGLCRDMMIFAAIGCPLTEDKAARDISGALAFFFTAEQIEQARSTLWRKK